MPLWCKAGLVSGVHVHDGGLGWSVKACCVGMLVPGTGRDQRPALERRVSMAYRRSHMRSPCLCTEASIARRAASTSRAAPASHALPLAIKKKRRRSAPFFPEASAKSRFLDSLFRSDLEHLRVYALVVASHLNSRREAVLSCR